MHALDRDFNCALAFAYTFVIVRVLAALSMGQPINVLAVIATYLLVGAVAVALRQSMHGATDLKAARTMTYVTLGSLVATAPEFW
ncbi:MAG TPA: hypothetical protein VNE58_07585 [Casimicrobiaceae bacterium]|nr:hypothetical protein [Casimicrobiaceae bacterium]